MGGNIYKLYTWQRMHIKKSAIIMNKQIVIYLPNGILFSNNKKWITDTCSIMDESKIQFAEWKGLTQKSIYCMIIVTGNFDPSKANL